MRQNENLMRNCTTCEYYGIGCEESCIFELEEAMEERPTLAKRRRNMKAEKVNAYSKSMQKLNTAENKATQTGYGKPRVNRDERGEYTTDKLPTSVFKAGMVALKMKRRQERRLEKRKK